MKSLVLCSLNLLFFVNIVYSEVTIYPNDTVPGTASFALGKQFVLECNITATNKDHEKLTVKWKKDNQFISATALRNRTSEKIDGDIYRLTVDNSDYSDAGEYTCEANVTDDSQAVVQKLTGKFIVESQINVRVVENNYNVVEEEKLKVQCKVLGNPPPILTWHISSEKYNDTNVTTVSEDGRVRIENTSVEGVFVTDGLLVIDHVVKEDRGLYTCIGHSPLDLSETNSTAMIRVKDKYAALWPFLCICVEVIVLCAIIIIYEKKRNKSELEESDTDQSPDQKNTPDHGKDSNLRHRQ